MKEKYASKIREYYDSLSSQEKELINKMALAKESLESARDDGDFSENVAYRLAKENLAKLNNGLQTVANSRQTVGRLLEEIENYVDEGFVKVGSYVKLSVVNKGQVAKSFFEAIVAEEGQECGLATFSLDSPVGKKLLGRVRGETFRVTTNFVTADYTVEVIS